MRSVLGNAGWLIVLPLLFNAALWSRLPASYSPAVFRRDIPAWIAWPEKVLRIIVCAAPFLMTLERRTPWLPAYFAGLAVYCACWLIALRWPAGPFLRHALGYSSLAYTAAFWLLGIAAASRAYGGPARLLRLLYALGAVVFAVFHTLHALTVFRRLR